jgi:putative flippase GtrA
LSGPDDTSREASSRPENGRPGSRLRRWLGRAGAREILAFLFVGLSNTVLTYAAYLGLLQVVHYAWAFTGAFLVGMVYTGLLNIRLTFARHPTLVAGVVFAAYYTGYWIGSLALLRLFVDGLGISETYAPLAMLPIVVPINFVMTRRIVNRFARARS